MIEIKTLGMGALHISVGIRVLHQHSGIVKLTRTPRSGLSMKYENNRLKSEKLVLVVYIIPSDLHNLVYSIINITQKT